MRFLTADKVFDGLGFLPQGTVLQLNEQNLLKGILHQSSIDPNRIEKLEGILCPGFVNVHCHLELSHLKGQVTSKRGLSAFAMDLMAKRNKVKAEELFEQMKAADREMWNNGIVAVGDICNGPESIRVKRESLLHYHSFAELIGLNPANAAAVYSRGLEMLHQFAANGLSASLAAHAPYSVSKELLKAIVAFDLDARLPFSLHCHESEEEIRFLHMGDGPISELYKFLSLDLAWYKPPAARSLEYFAQELGADPCILVHNTVNTAEDAPLVSHQNIYWAFCPAANLYIENKLPEFSLFKAQSFCVGTDSLASNDSLDIIKELNLMVKNKGVFSTEELLRAATSTGADALCLPDFGVLRIGKNAGLNLLEEKNRELKLIRKIC